ncbi:MAG: cobalamin biosynthesis protein CbiG, partial [Pseudomonadota bacterium]
TGLTAPIPNSEKGPHCIIAEIYPSTLDVSPQPQEIMDRAQVRSLATRFFQQDSAGQLATAFHAPNSLDRRILRKIEAEEGWILAI